MSDEKRSFPGSLVFLVGLFMTGYFSYVAFQFEQEAAEQRLIQTGTLISEAMTREVASIDQLIQFAMTLSPDELTQLQSLHPEIVGAGVWQPGPEPAGGELRWHLVPPDYLLVLSETLPAPGKSLAGKYTLSRTVETVNADGSQQDAVYAFTPSGSEVGILALTLTARLDTALRSFRHAEIQVEVFDLKRFGRDPFLTRQLSQKTLKPEKTQTGWLAELVYQDSINLADGNWLIRMHPLETFLMRSNWLLPLTIFISGLIISALLTVLFMRHPDGEEN